MFRSSSQRTVTEVQGECAKCCPEPTLCCGSDPGCAGQLSSHSCQVPEAVAAAMELVQQCCILGELVPLQSQVGVQRLLCDTLLEVLGQEEDTLSELL